jgi:hypothetical protein
MMTRILIVLLLVGAYCIRPLQAQNSIAVSAFPTYGWLKYSKHDVSSKGDFDIGFGLTFRHQFSENWQFAIGVNYRTYHGTIDYKGMVDSVRMTEPAEGHNYFLYQTFNSTEAQTVTFVEPNIRLDYIQPLSRHIDFIAGLGLVYGIHIAETNQMTGGSYNRYAWYYENHNTIDYLPSMNLDTYEDFLNPLLNNAFKHSFFALGEVGFRFHLSRRWQLLTMLNVQHSLLNVQAKQRDIFTHHWSYSGIVASEIPKGVRAISTGVEIGLSFLLESQPKKSSRNPGKIRSLHCPH